MTSLTESDTAAEESGFADADLKPIKPPTALPGSAYITSITGIGLLALAAIAVHDLIIKADWVQGTQWYAATFRWISRLSWHDWMWPVAIAMIVVGLLVLWVAFKPRKKTHVEFYANTIWTRRIDIARRASAVARTFAGVDAATTVVTRRKAKVNVVLAEKDPQTVKEIQTAVADAISHLTSPVKVVIKAKTRPTRPSSVAAAASGDDGSAPDSDDSSAAASHSADTSTGDSK